MFGLTSSAKRARYRAIGSVLARHGLGAAATQVGLSWILPFHRGLLGHARRDHPYSTAEHVRLALEELGTTAIKLGQILSTRPDLVPPELETELERLRDRLPPVPAEAIVSVVEREMGKPISVAFERFDPAPIASASIGQVHGASLRDGTSVVVKVRKPGVVDVVNADLAIVADLANRIARAEDARGYDVVALADDFAWTLRSELDYIREAQNAERLRTILAEDPRIAVPAIHHDLSTRAVLVMERMEGVGIGDLDGLDALGVDRTKLARVSAEALMTQVFGAGLFHADPHPGNFLVLDDGRIAMLDFGMVGQLDDETKRALVSLLLATTRQDADMMVGAMEALGVVQDPSARTAVRRDVRRLLDDYYGLSVDRFDLGLPQGRAGDRPAEPPPATHGPRDRAEDDRDERGALASPRSVLQRDRRGRAIRSGARGGDGLADDDGPPVATRDRHLARTRRGHGAVDRGCRGRETSRGERPRAVHPKGVLEDRDRDRRRVVLGERGDPRDGVPAAGVVDPSAAVVLRRGGHRRGPPDLPACLEASPLTGSRHHPGSTVSRRPLGSGTQDQTPEA